jgi:predicted ribosomally synthesized peptide with nif11-like leader
VQISSIKENKIMNNLTPELIAKAKAAKNTEELLELAKENGVELSEEEAKTCFEQLHANVEVSDDELEAVSGGGICQDIIDFFQSGNGRNDSTCPHCGDKPKISTIPAKPEFDSSIKPLPYDTVHGDPNDKNKIVFL